MHPSISLEDSPRETAAQSLPLLANEEGDRSAAVRLEEMRDAAQSGVYSALFALQDNVACAKSEVLLGSFWGHVVLVPGLPFGLGKKEVRHLPWNNLARTSLSIRRAARVMVSLGEAIEAGDRARVLQAMPSGEALLREVARAGHAVLEQIRRAFPTERGVTHEAALRLLGAVKAWEAAAGEAAHSQLQAWHRYQVTLASWEVMERTVSSTTLREHLSGPSSLPAREVALGTGPGAGAGAVVSPPEAAKDQQPPCPPMPPTPPLQKAEEDERKSPFANAGKVATRAPKGGEGGQAMVGALPEWQMLTFLLRQLSLAVVDVYECLLSVMEDIPRIEG